MSLLIQYWLLRAFMSILQGMSLEALRGLARRAGIFGYRVVGLRRTVVLEQLRAAFPGKDEAEIDRIAEQSYISICTTFLELAWAPNLTADFFRRQTRLENPEVVRNALARGRGLLFLMGHFGSWECVPYSMTINENIVGKAIVHPMHNERLDRLIQSYRSQFGWSTIPMSRAGLEGYRYVRNGGMLVVLTDQSAPPDSLFVPFLGRPATVFKGAAVFAQKTGAPMVLGIPLRQDNGSYRIRFEEIPTDRLPSDPERALEVLTWRHVKALERVILDRPGDWFWHHRRWKHTPGPQSRIVADPEE
jgi:Kdo2-lipid IVA lauroyltransferase/acyltransferase